MNKEEEVFPPVCLQQPDAARAPRQVGQALSKKAREEKRKLPGPPGEQHLEQFQRLVERCMEG